METVRTVFWTEEMKTMHSSENLTYGELHFQLDDG
jgi:hypothetical protein